MGIGDFHAVDLDEDEVVEFLRLNAGVQLCDDFAHGGCFAGAGGAADVDAGAGAGGDGGFEVGVDGAEFGGSAGKGGGDGGDMQVIAGELEGGGGCVMWREDAGCEGGEA